MAVSERKLSELKLIEQAQPRQRMDLDVVAEYAEVIRGGRDLPPIVVFGAYVGDGFHRKMAYESAGKTTIPTITHQGGQREAILYSCSANAAHGLRRTNADKRRSVLKVLRDEEWGKWSSRKIAEHCGVDHHTVETLRGEFPQVERTFERAGKEQTVTLRPEPKPRQDNTVKRILSAILLLAKSSPDNFDSQLTEPQRARLHDEGDLQKARAFLDSL
jgi:hypothetical protein